MFAADMSHHPQDHSIMSHSSESHDEHVLILRVLLLFAQLVSTHASGVTTQPHSFFSTTTSSNVILHGPRRLHDITPRTTSFATSHIAKETTRHNIISEILNFFSEFAELRSSSTPSSQQPPPRK
jgi:hypothetical protein